MSFIVYKYRYENGKKFGPYAHEVEAVWENGTCKQRHIAYLGRVSGSSGGSGVASSEPKLVDPEAVRTVEKLTRKFSTEGEEIDLDSLSDSELEIIQSVGAWVEGSPLVVRDPSKWGTPEMERDHYSFGYAVGGVTTSKGRNELGQDQYQTANRVMSTFASEPYTNKRTLLRGMDLEKSAVDSLTVGKTFSLGPVASFTPDKETASIFTGAHVHAQGPRVSVILRAKSGAMVRGKDITKLNYMGEAEVVSSGTVRVLRKTWSTRDGAFVIDIAQE